MATSEALNWMSVDRKSDGLVQFVTMKIQFNFTDSALWPNRNELNAISSLDHKLTHVVREVGGVFFRRLPAS